MCSLFSMKSLKIPKGGNQNPYIEEEQTTQWAKDTKGVIRIHISKKEQTTQWAKEKSTKGQTTIYKTYT